MWSRPFAVGACVALVSSCSSFAESSGDDSGGDAGADATNVGNDGGTATPSDAYAAAVLADSPLAYWRLREKVGPSLASEVGDQRLVVRNDPALGAPGLFGGSGSGVGFDGVKGRRLVASTLAPLVAAGRGFAVEGWFYFANPPDDSARYLVSQSDGVREIGVFVRGPNLTTDLTYDGARAFLNLAAPSTGTWHHVVIQAENIDTLAVWFDGIEDAKADKRAQVADAQHALTFGSSDDGAPAIGPDARAAELAVYDHVLAGARILAHYELGTK